MVKVFVTLENPEPLVNNEFEPPVNVAPDIVTEVEYGPGGGPLAATFTVTTVPGTALIVPLPEPILALK